MSSKEQQKGNWNRRPKQLPDKVFALRNSLLTDLFTITHFQAVEHIITAILFFVTLTSAVSNYMEHGDITEIFPDTGFLKYGFLNSEAGFRVWLKMVLSTLIFYPLVRLWAAFRPAGSIFSKIDAFFVFVYFTYQAFFIWLTYDILFKNPILGPCAATAVSLEQMRLFAKMHAFAREMLRKALQPPDSATQKKTDAEEIVPKQFPKFTWYLYFLCAPTLIYRDNYPQSPTRRWSYIFLYFLQWLGCSVAFYVIFDHFLLKEYDMYLSAPVVTNGMIFRTFIRGTVPGTALFHLFFFGFFQCWSNMWAELLRFGDRLFYEDFWNVTDPAQYSRKWNLIVHDWLYVYGYKETYDLQKKKGGKLLPAIVAFALSSIFHEFVMTVMLHFFLPVFLFYLSGLGVLSVVVGWPKIGVRVDNFLAWLQLCCTFSVWFVFYFYEVVARQICPAVSAEYENAWLAPPRFWTCFPTNH